MWTTYTNAEDLLYVAQTLTTRPYVGVVVSTALYLPDCSSYSALNSGLWSRSQLRYLFL